MEKINEKEKEREREREEEIEDTTDERVSRGDSYCEKCLRVRG